MLSHLKSLCSQNDFNSQITIKRCGCDSVTDMTESFQQICCTDSTPAGMLNKSWKCALKKEKASRQQMDTSMLKVQSDFIPVDRYTFPVLSRDYYKIFPSLFVFVCLCGVPFTILNAPVEYFPLNAVILLFCSLYLFYHHRKCYLFMIGWFHKNSRNVKVILHTKCVLLKENKAYFCPHKGFASDNC